VFSLQDEKSRKNTLLRVELKKGIAENLNFTTSLLFMQKTENNTCCSFCREEKKNKAKNTVSFVLAYHLQRKGTSFFQMHQLRHFLSFNT